MTINCLFYRLHPKKWGIQIKWVLKFGGFGKKLYFCCQILDFNYFKY